MGSMGLVLGSRLHPEQVDHFDGLPDSVLLLIFNRVGDVKTLGRCCVVSRRLRALVPQVDDVIVRVDCVISDDDSSSSGTSSSVSVLDKSRYPIASLFRLFFSGLVKPLHSFITPDTWGDGLLPLMAEWCRRELKAFESFHFYDRQKNDLSTCQYTAHRF